jgi:hypothetical protein
LIDVLKLVKSLNVNSIQFQPLLENNLVLEKRLANSPLWVPQSRLFLLDKVIDELVAYKEKNGDFISNPAEGLKLMKRYFRNKLSNKDIKCYSLFKTMLIANDGSLNTCGMNYGNVREKTLRKCWKSKEALEARKKIKKCEKPCILPCFTDAGLNSLLLIFSTFLESLDNLKNIDVSEKNVIINKCLNILEKYRNLLLTTKSEISLSQKYKINKNSYGDDLTKINETISEIEIVRQMLNKRLSEIEVYEDH